MTEAHEQAAEMLRVMIEQQQAVMRCTLKTPVEDIRSAARRAARKQGLRMRTALVGDVLVVVRDAALWAQDVVTMRRKLQAPDLPNVIA